MEGMPFYYRMIRGAIGKKFVVKHYKGGKIVRTKFPDMSGIVPTEKQKVRRDLFREAVVFAKWIIGDEERKLAFKSTLPRKKRKKVYQAALQMYMREKGNKLWVSKQLAVMAVVESSKCELIKWKGDYEQQGQWRVMWQKMLNEPTSKVYISNNVQVANCSPAFTT
jgi:hypothetical protein